MKICAVQQVETPIQHTVKKAFFYRRKIRLAPTDEDITALLRICENIDGYFNAPEKNILKDDPSSTIIRVPSDGHAEIVVRRDNDVNTATFIKRSFRKSRSRKIWDNDRHMRRLGLNTIKPIALIEDYSFFVRTKSYVVCEYINGMTLKAYFSDPTISALKKEKIAATLVKSIHKWHALGITHGDPKASNIMIQEEDIYFIDTEDIGIYRTAWRKRHAIARDNYIILHNWQAYPEHRDHWVRQFLADFPYGMNYFGKCLVKKFWKTEYALFSSGYAKRRDAINVLEKTVAATPLPAWLNINAFKKTACPLSKEDAFCCVVSKRAFFFETSIDGYFKKKRIPRKGVFSLTVALRICGFNLPEIIDGGIFTGVEYLVFGQPAGLSLHRVWETVKNNPLGKGLFLTALAEEIGRLHAMGFTGVIRSIDSIFIKTENSSFGIGFKPNSHMRYRPGARGADSLKEMGILGNEFLSQLPAQDRTVFLDNYNKVRRKTRQGVSVR